MDNSTEFAKQAKIQAKKILLHRKIHQLLQEWAAQHEPLEEGEIAGEDEDSLMNVEEDKQ